MRARLMLAASAMLAGISMFGSAASAQTVQFFTVLAGGNEVPTGDPNGQGVASVMLGASGQVCFSILTRLIATPIAAHIHEGKPGVAGPIVIPLTAPTPAGIPQTFTSVGCLTGQNTAVLARLKATPSNFYINVHTGPHPAGAARGQLF